MTRREKRIYLINMLGGKCVRCNVTYGLEFDHIDHHIKSFTIGHCERKLEVLIYEAGKCRLLCKSCHRKRTNLQQKSLHKNPNPAQRLRRAANRIMDNWQPNVFP